MKLVEGARESTNVEVRPPALTPPQPARVDYPDGSGSTVVIDLSRLRFLAAKALELTQFTSLARAQVDGSGVHDSVFGELPESWEALRAYRGRQAEGAVEQRELERALHLLSTFVHQAVTGSSTTTRKLPKSRGDWSESSS